MPTFDVFLDGDGISNPSEVTRRQSGHLISGMYGSSRVLSYAIARVAKRASWVFERTSFSADLGGDLRGHSVLSPLGDALPGDFVIVFGVFFVLAGDFIFAGDLGDLGSRGEGRFLGGVQVSTDSTESVSSLSSKKDTPLL